MCRHPSLSGGQTLDFAVERGKRLLQHLAVRGCGGAVQIPLGPRPCQFQRPPALRGGAFCGRQRDGAAGGPASRLFLLGFYELGIESTCHPSIVRAGTSGNE